MTSRCLHAAGSAVTEDSSVESCLDESVRASPSDAAAISARRDQF